MAGFPLSFINQITNTNTDNGIVQDIEASNTKALMELLDGLSSGETLLGKIVSSDENSYSFKTENNVYVNARAEKGVILEEGSNVLFEVKKSTATNSVSLRPLSTNTNASQTAATALKQAGIPVNNRSLEMTVRLMEYGEPVDKQSLSDNYKDVYTHPDTPVKYIVDMQEMNIPVNDANIEQFEAYENMENSLTESLFSIADSLSDGFIEKFEQVFNETEASFSSVKSSIPGEVADRVTEFVNKLTDSTNKGLNVTDTQVSRFVDELISGLDEVVHTDESVTDKTGENATLPGFGTDLSGEISSDDFKAVLKPVIKDALLNIINNNYRITKDKTFEIADIKDLYEKLFSDTKRLTKVLEDNFPKNETVNSKLTTLSNNLDFMNDLNNFVPYIQIPFEGENGTKNGELYVFKNKHSLTDGDGELTAFVHLDTDNLGPADVYVKLKDMHVSTHFYLASEESLDFVEKHLSLLDKRLTDKGYSVSFDASVSKEDSSPMEKMMEENLNKIYVCKSSFDARV